MAGEGQPKAGAAGLRLHHLRPAPGARKARTRVGRGEGSKGKTAGRGTKQQRDSLRSLGLKRIGDVVVREDKPEFRGMIRAVRHLVTVEQVD